MRILKVNVIASWANLYITIRTGIKVQLSNMLTGLRVGKVKISISTWVNDDCTVGRLQCGDFRCLTLELPWKGNQRNVSCIPAGVYSGVIYESPKHGEVILLEDVPGRSMIEMHAGNYTRQIKGCILPGDGLKYLDNDDVLDVTNSRKTLRQLISLLPNRFTVEIERTHA